MEMWLKRGDATVRCLSETWQICVAETRGTEQWVVVFFLCVFVWHAYREITLAPELGCPEFLRHRLSPFQVVDAAAPWKTVSNAVKKAVFKSLWGISVGLGQQIVIPSGLLAQLPDPPTSLCSPVTGCLPPIPSCPVETIASLFLLSHSCTPTRFTPPVKIGSVSRL